MSTGTEGPHYDVTRAALIEALGSHPLTATLNAGARGRFADVILEGMPEASGAAFYMEGVKAERRRVTQRLATAADRIRESGDD